MRWEKLGLVYVARGEQPWAISHAYIPTAWLVAPDRIRVYAAFLDGAGVGRVGFADVAADDPRRVLRISREPALDIGEPGTFDDNGVAPLCLVHDGQRLRLYYLGFQAGVKVRYTMFVGLATSDDGERFQRHARVPVLDRSDAELFVRSAANVHREGAAWKMWYVAGDRWIDVGGKQVPTYNVRYLESQDGVTWPSSGKLVLDLEDDEFGLGRPFVLREGGLYRMWYSSRRLSRGYRLRYAESANGLDWIRRDAALGIDVSESGWDSEMICCSCVLNTSFGTYMFYNGNNYGQTGFGVAVLRS